MKRNLLFWLLAFAVGVVLPCCIFSIAEKAYFVAQSDKIIETTEDSAHIPIETTKPNEDLVLVLTDRGLLEKMDMNTYLTGVLLGELPADFETETLKAQAIVARTYAKKRSQTDSKHPMGAVCVISSCCQAYCSPEDYIRKGGNRNTIEKFENAVNSTSGMILTYQNELIDATYFSCSGGRTEDALAVWGTDVPYLQSVDSPGEEEAVHYADQIQMSLNEFGTRLGVELAGAPVSWLGKVSYTPGGGVETMVIGGVIFRGVELRQKLNLYSTAFSIIPVGETVHIYTKGFGHRVGMSQYGADAMAACGNNYQEILAHYYHGTTLNSYLD